MTESFRPPLALSALGALAPDAASAGRGFSAQRSQPDTFAELRCWLAGAAACFPRRQQLQPPRCSPMPHRWGRRGGRAVVPPSRPLLDCARGHRDRTFAIRSAVSRSLASAWPSGAWALSRCPGDRLARKGPKAAACRCWWRNDGRSGSGPRPMLEVVGRPINHLGPGGCGQQAKAATRCGGLQATTAVAEAMACGQRLGLADGARLSGPSQGRRAPGPEKPAGGMLEGSFRWVSSWRCTARNLAIALAAGSRHRVELLRRGKKRVAAMPKTPDRGRQGGTVGPDPLFKR